MRAKLLKKIIFERGQGIGSLAKKAGIKKSLMWLRLMGIGEFRAWEILKISGALGLDKNQLQAIFFDEKVSFRKQKR
ncbi:MAG: XRE family transcriptional regulator [Clostridia bacterium]|nr:XRE family transcriptional regulator [Clostridia bacterium]